MSNTYKTSEVAKKIGIHPSTVRLYEQLGLIPPPHRLPNGYRVFTDIHIEQFKLARAALKVEILQGNLRKMIINIIKLSAHGKFNQAIACTNDYIQKVKIELSKAKEAIEITDGLLSGIIDNECTFNLTRKQAAEHLGVTMDTLRNWELNGLFTAKRKSNGYRVYTQEDIKMLKIIRTLRCANYSLEAILRMMQALSNDPNVNIKKVLDTPKANDDIISVCDQLISSLKAAQNNAEGMLTQLRNMNKKFNNPTL